MNERANVTAQFKGIADWSAQFKGIAGWSAQFIQEKQLLDETLWKKFADVFRSQPDGSDQGWRGEFWGKMLRGGALIYEYTKDPELYRVLTNTIQDMLAKAEADGRISTYSRDTEFDAWDIWIRKYVMLGMEYYLDICRDEALKREIEEFICRCADYIIEHIGKEEGKKNITDATRSWLGLNSSSVLEPIVRLYKLTGEKRYLDFATYIVNEGGAKGVNVFELAYENQLLPYQYGVSKAYEMMSCFEGLLEYYYITGIEKHKTAVLNFGKAVMESEVSIIGTCGVTHELFDHTRVRQTVRQDEVMQETCVTVTWMKFCSRLLQLTGESIYADCMEQSFYNAYIGAFNTENKMSPYAYQKFVKKQNHTDMKDTYLAFDGYSPLTAGKRGIKIGGSQLLEDHSYYGCCACIGAAGSGVFLKNALLCDDEGIVLNFFEEGELTVQYEDVPVHISIHTLYPVDGQITVRIQTEKPIEFTLKVRVPGWTGEQAGYQIYRKVWSDDTLVICYEMQLKQMFPETWEEDIVYTDTTGNSQEHHCATAQKVYHKEEEEHYMAFTRGPLVLAADARTGRDVNGIFDCEAKGIVCASKEIIEGVPCLLKMEFTEQEGQKFYLVDYASAGKDWETEIAAWLPIK